MLDNKTIKYTSEQGTAIQTIPEILLNKRVAALSGYAGTGKTTVTMRIVHEFLKHNDAPVHFCAATHPAAAVLRRMHKVSATTVHSELRLRPGQEVPKVEVFDDPRKNEQLRRKKFNKMVEATIKDYGNPTDPLLVVDEYSMLGPLIMSVLLGLSEKGDARVLFVGDPAQLPPINTPDYGEKGDFNHLQFFQDHEISNHWLTEIKRQDTINPLVDLTMGMREGMAPELPGNQSLIRGEQETVFSEQVYGLSLLRSAPGRSSYIGQLSQFLTNVIRIVEAMGGRRPNPDRIMVAFWRNAEVDLFNKVAMEYLYGEDIWRMPFVRGSQWLAQNTVSHGYYDREEKKWQSEVIVGNGQTIEITDSEEVQWSDAFPEKDVNNLRVLKLIKQREITTPIYRLNLAILDPTEAQYPTPEIYSLTGDGYLTVTKELRRHAVSASEQLIYELRKRKTRRGKDEIYDNLLEKWESEKDEWKAKHGETGFQEFLDHLKRLDPDEREFPQPDFLLTRKPKNNNKKEFISQLQQEKEYLIELEAASRDAWYVLNKLKDKCLSVRPPYARTIHKAQGAGTEVLFTSRSIAYVRKPQGERQHDYTRRLCYTALTRAARRVLLFEDFPNLNLPGTAEKLSSMLKHRPRKNNE